MTKDNRDILELLQEELSFVEEGGYGRSVRTPWKPKSAFQDSLTCINYTFLEKVHPCNECHLLNFVPEERRAEEVPCHFIPLTNSGDTIDDLEPQDQQKLEAKLKAWLRWSIAEIESSRLATPESLNFQGLASAN